MGTRRVRISYSVDIDIDATVSWPDSGSPDGDDPREVSDVSGVAERDQALLDAILGADPDEQTHIDCAVIEAHDQQCGERALLTLLKDRILKRFDVAGPGEWAGSGQLRVKSETPEQKAARLERARLGHEVCRELEHVEIEASRPARDAQPDMAFDGPLTEGEVDAVRMGHLLKAARRVIERQKKAAPGA